MAFNEGPRLTSRIPRRLSDVRMSFHRRLEILFGLYDCRVAASRAKKTFEGDRLPTLKRKRVPHEFVLEALAPVSPWTRPMFGCLAVYVGEKIVLVLRDKNTEAQDNGVWLATTSEHHESLRSDFPNMRSIQLLGKEVTGWRVLPVNAPDFEESAERACEFILAGDLRIGRIPGTRRQSQSRAKKATKSPKRR
jgi:hypothetical protein